MDELNEYLLAARKAPYLKKKDWILDAVVGKRVLDLGVVDHVVERALSNDEHWLHGQIRERASYLRGIDIDEPSIRKLSEAGYNVTLGDAASVRLDEKFDIVVCGDLIEHIADPLGLLATVSYHLEADGRAYVSTPNALSAARVFSVLADGTAAVNPEHLAWYCPQTLNRLISLSELKIDRLVWLETDYPAVTRRRGWGRVINAITPRLSARNRLLSDDFGVELIKR